jgi:hypothetical protein
MWNTRTWGSAGHSLEQHGRKAKAKVEKEEEDLQGGSLDPADYLFYSCSEISY